MTEGLTLSLSVMYITVLQCSSHLNLHPQITLILTHFNKYEPSKIHWSWCPQTNTLFLPSASSVWSSSHFCFLLPSLFLSSSSSSSLSLSLSHTHTHTYTHRLWENYGVLDLTLSIRFSPLPTTSAFFLVNQFQQAGLDCISLSCNFSPFATEWNTSKSYKRYIS